MEILILEKWSTRKAYSKIYADSVQMNALAVFFNEMAVMVDVCEWVEGGIHPSIATEMVAVEVENDMVRVYEHFFDNTLEQEEYLYENAFITTYDKFMEILRWWKQVQEKDPRYIIIKKINNNFFFEEDYQEQYDMDFSKATLSERSLENISKPKIKDGHFYGGFHLLNKQPEKNIEMKNKLTANENVLSYDIKFANDFTFNHAFFPSDWDKERLKKGILYVLDPDRCSPTDDFEKVSNKNGIFYAIYKVAKGMVDMRVIFNQNLEIISCYPIFEVY
jgi:hypothetical protein